MAPAYKRLEMRSPYKVGDNNTPLVFSTTLGVRYAIGIGDFGAIRINLTAADDEPVVSQPVESGIFHEISLHVSSGLTF